MVKGNEIGWLDSHLPMPKIGAADNRAHVFIVKVFPTITANHESWKQSVVLQSNHVLSSKSLKQFENQNPIFSKTVRKTIYSRQQPIIQKYLQPVFSRCSGEAKRFLTHVVTKTHHTEPNEPHWRKFPQGWWQERPSFSPQKALVLIIKDAGLLQMITIPRKVHTEKVCPKVSWAQAT